MNAAMIARTFENQMPHLGRWTLDVEMAVPEQSKF